MFSSGGEKPNIVIKSQSGTNLTLLVFALGILSLASIGVMTLSVVKQLRPTAFTAINKQLNYQGKLQNAGGITLADGNYSMKFSIYDDPTAGSRLWTECGTTGTPTARTVAVASGVFSVMLGDTNSNSCPGGTDSNVINLDFNSDNYYLGLTVESDSEMLPRKRLGASGYAFNADLLDGLNTSNAGGTTAFVPVTDSSGNLVLSKNFTVDSTTLFVDATGHEVGIGNIVPAAKLDITDAQGGIYTDATVRKAYGLIVGTPGTTGSSMFVNTPSLNSSFNSGLGIDGSYNSMISVVNLKALGVYSGGGYGSVLAFYTSSGATDGTERMRIDSSGNVQIASLSVSSAVYTDGSKNLTSTAPTSGAIGYWSRATTTLSPTTAGDSISIVGGNISASKNDGVVLTLQSASDTYIYPYTSYVRSNGTLASPTNVVAGNIIGSTNYYGKTDGGYVGVAAFTASVVSLNGNNIVGQLNFGVSDGTTSGSNFSAFTANATTTTFNTASTVLAGRLNMLTVLGQASAPHSISWYNSDYVTWHDYMGPPGTTNSPSGTPAASDTAANVTSWARRFNIENAATYGWIFESGVNGAGNAPTAKFAINASTGDIHSIGKGLFDGIVGVGDTTPDASLEVVNDGSGDSFLVADTNDGDTTPFVIQSDGDVGIGDSTPAALLTVGNTDLFQVNSSGAIAAATGITSSGTINFSTLSASSAVYTDGSKNLTSTAPTSGTIGYWSRASTTLSPATANDIVAVTGNSGDLLTLTSTATGANNKALNIAASGATTGTDYGAYISNTGAGTTNVGLYVTASGGVTNNYAAVFAAGNVGVGTTTPSYLLDVNGTARLGSKQVISVTRTLPTTVDDTVDIGSFATTHAHSITASIVVNDDGFSVSKKYILTSYYSQTGGVWKIVPAISDTGAYSGNNFQLEANQSTGTLTFRIRRTAGATAGTANITFDYESASSGVFTPSTATASGVPAITDYYPTSLITQTGSGVGIGTTTPRKLTDFLSTSQAQLRLSYTDNSVYTDFTTDTSGILTIAPSGGYLYLPNQMRFAGDTDNGFYYSSANNWRVMAGGSSILEFDASGVYVGGSGNIGSGNNITLTLKSFQADGATKVAVASDTYYAFVTAGAKLFSFKNNGTEKAYIDKDGNAYLPGANISGLTASSAVYTDGSKNLTSTAPTSGTIGYWSRSGTTLSPATANDVVSVSGTGATAITGTSSAAGGKGIYGTATDATAVANYGGYFTAAGTIGYSAGVYGEASGAADLVLGVHGVASATGAVSNFGGVFTGAGNTGRGVYGEATATGAYTNYGVYGMAAGDTGRAVYGTANATTSAVNYGGYFVTSGEGTFASGVYGEASGAGSVFAVRGYASNPGAVTNTGGAFTALGETGRGVYGQASSTDAAVNYGGYFVANGTGGGTSGVFGTADGAAAVYGVKGTATSSAAVANYGGYFTAAGTSNAVAVYAEATGAGLVGGVYGLASDATAGTMNFGGLFVANGPHSWSWGVKGDIPNSVGGKAVWGHAGETTSTNYGGYFEADGATGIGVYGKSTYTTPTTVNYGGYFTSAGDAGRGVYGEATATGSGYGFGGEFTTSTIGSFSSGVKATASGAASGVRGVTGLATGTGSISNYGGYFYAAGDQGIGVYSEAPATGDVTNYGGYFTVAGNYGTAVYGNATATGVANGYGGYFTSAGNTGRGVYVTATATGAVTNYGGYFISAGNSGMGVRSDASATGAVTNYGGYFTSAGDAGIAILGHATSTNAGTTTGGYFMAESTGSLTSGVYGLASGAGGVVGIYGSASATGAVTNFGGRFIAAGETGIAVYGDATSSGATVNYGGKFYAEGSGGAYGVYAESTAGSGTNYGVYGVAGKGYGVYGTGTTGVYGTGTTGVYGYYSATQYGYLGSATYGVYGYGSVGVYGTDGTRYGQLGYASAGVYGTDGARYGQLGTGSYGVYGYFDATHSGYIGSASYGVYGTGADGEGVHGEATSGYGVRGNSATGYGVAGFLSGTSGGRAVWGSAYGGTGASYGGYFNSSSTTGVGVYGLADAAGAVFAVKGEATSSGAVANYGGYFYAAGSSGALGVYGEAANSTGVNYGVGGLVSSTSTGAAGVKGQAGGAGTVYGVQGAATNTGAVTNYGGYFTSAGDTGRGVYGSASDSGAVVNYGGYFSSAGTGTGATGVFGTTAATGTVYGVQGAASNTGAYTNYGGYFTSDGTTGRAVYGEAYSNGATVNYGGYFVSDGTAAGATGVLGTTAASGTVYGVQGTATNTGAVTNYGGYFSAAGTTGRAVYGDASSSSAAANYGGFFIASGTSGARAVYATADGASGTNYGVYGAVTSATGYAGYFTGGYGVYASLAHIAGTGAGGEELDVEGQIQLDLDGTTDTTIGVCKSVADGAGVEADVEFRDCTSTPSDIAEWYDTTGTEPGDVVAATDDTVTFQGEMYDPLTGLPLGVQETLTATILTPSSEPYQHELFGVVSTNPIQSFGKGVIDVAHLPNPIAVVGRVPTKVSTENGVIRPGDPITSSSVPGVGMKATKPGMIIGYAVDHYSGVGVGTAFININPGWHSGFAINTDGAISLFDDDFTFNTSGVADGIIQGYNSKGLAFRGSGWDGAAAQNIEMKIGNVVTDASNYKLSVLNNAGTEVAYLDQAGALGLSGKFYPASPTGAQSDAYIFYRNNRIRTNASGWATGSFDFAEMFLSRELLEAGDVVILDETTNEYVKKSTATYDKMALGIVSTEPGFLAGTNVNFDDPSADQGYPIALAGRVPTKVSTENGPIRPGDFLTTSATSGAAMKATESGIIIGTALESFDGPGTGLIKVFVNLAWYNVSGEATPVGEMSQLTLSGDLNMNGNYILNVGKIVGQDEKWSIDENGILKIKLVAEDASEKEMFGLTSAKVELTLSGTGRLENGTSMIDLSLIDPDFIKNISTETVLKVIVTLTEPANGIYVAEKTAYSFRVAELNAGTSDAAFDWIVIARRKGYEDPAAESLSVAEPAPAVPSEPAPAEPAPSEPAPSEPAPSEPAPSEPAPSEPAPAVPSEPAPAEPAPSEPAPSEPAPSEPAPSEPAPSEPAPTP